MWNNLQYLLTLYTMLYLHREEGLGQGGLCSSEQPDNKLALASSIATHCAIFQLLALHFNNVLHETSSGFGINVLPRQAAFLSAHGN